MSQKKIAEEIAKFASLSSATDKTETGEGSGKDEDESGKGGIPHGIINLAKFQFLMENCDKFDLNDLD
ncbi:hypothetical protein HK096_002945 [Nowakowskiella sp. JEL0078]|nr:hypothetical protein HK096_002945 [Nowakowskiella sp. JEL0078]